jgi:hypothetical protein
MSEEQVDSIIRSIDKKIEQIFERSFRKMRGDRIGGIDLAMEVTGYKRATIYQRVSEGVLPHSKDKRKLWFSEQALCEYLLSMNKTPKVAYEQKKEQFYSPKKSGRKSLLGQTLENN